MSRRSQGNLPYKIDDGIIEVGFDFAGKILCDGLLKEFPLYKTIKSFIENISNLRDYLFAKKIYEFLFQLHKFSEEEIKEFAVKFSQDKDKEKIGEKIIIYLERADDITKARMMADVFKAYLFERITEDEMLRIYYGIDKVYIDDIYKIESVSSGIPCNNFRMHNLHSCGFIKLVTTHQAAYLDSGKAIAANYYEISKLGKLLIDNISTYNK